MDSSLGGMVKGELERGSGDDDAIGWVDAGGAGESFLLDYGADGEAKVADDGIAVKHAGKAFEMAARFVRLKHPFEFLAGQYGKADSAQIMICQQIIEKQLR